MLSHPCPSCGAPAPLALNQTESLDCPSCSVRSPLPDVVQAKLRRGQALLDGLQARDRQLSGVRALLVQSGESVLVGYGVFALLMGWPMILWGMGGLRGVWEASGPADAAGPFSMLCSLVVAILVLSLGGLRLFSLRRRLQDATAAMPPAAEGEPARCHVCAAPVVAGASKVVRCGHCDADNVVDPKVVARVTARGIADLDDLEGQISSEGGAIARSVSASALAGVGCTLVAPYGCAIPLMLVGLFFGSLLEALIG